MTSPSTEITNINRNYISSMETAKTAVYVSGYSCGFRTKRGENLTNLVKWERKESNLDCCWTCACYITDDGKIVYLGFCNDVASPNASLVSSPTEPIKEKFDQVKNEQPPADNYQTSVSGINYERMICIVGDKSATLPDHTCSWCITAVNVGFSIVVCGWRLLAAITRQNSCILWRDIQFDKPILPSTHDSNILVKSISLGDKYSAVLTPDGEAFELKLEDTTYTLQQLTVPKVKQVSCGKEHVLLLTTDGSVFSYGLGSRGQLGHSGLTNENVPRKVEALDGVAIASIAAGGWHSAALDTIGSVYMWGWNESGQLALPCSKVDSQRSDNVSVEATPNLVNFPLEVTITKISLGSRHSAAIADDGKLWSWGWNGYGQLCLGDKQIRDVPTAVNISPVSDVACRDWSTIVWAASK
uniref:RCC1-like domain-containing protein n=1 Tax=Strigamia maritima TaxID=126957 RepID=T1IIC6_STRMM